RLLASLLERFFVRPTVLLALGRHDALASWMGSSDAMTPQSGGYLIVSDFGLDSSRLATLSVIRSAAFMARPPGPNEDRSGFGASLPLRVAVSVTDAILSRSMPLAAEGHGKCYRTF